MSSSWSSSRRRADGAARVARAVTRGDLVLAKLADIPAEEAHAALTAIHGIGPWTADIYLLANLGHADAWPAGVTAHRIDISRRPGRLRKRNGGGEIACRAATEKTGNLEHARLIPKLVASLDFAHQLELSEGRIEVAAFRADAASRSFG